MIDKLLLKLEILNSTEKNLPNLRFKIIIFNFQEDLNKAISKGTDFLERIDSIEYHSRFCFIAFNVLSSSPFASLTHVCSALECTQHALVEWVNTHSEFKKSIDRGIVKGEVLARDLLSSASVEQASTVNTKLLLTLSSNVYNIQEKEKESEDTTSAEDFAHQIQKALSEIENTIPTGE